MATVFEPTLHLDEWRCPCDISYRLWPNSQQDEYRVVNYTCANPLTGCRWQHVGDKTNRQWHYIGRSVQEGEGQ